LGFWLRLRGLPLLFLYIGLFLANGLTIGWRTAYDVSIQITSPADTRVPALALSLSLAGWLLVPGLVGAVAGYVVTDAITAHRGKPLAEIFEEYDDESSHSPT
jgi:hypothetical protein